MVENQYKKIFKDFRNIIDKNSSKGINALRENAYDAFCRNGFPDKKLEDYKYIDVAIEFASDFALNLNRKPLTGDPYKAFRCEVPNMPSNLYYVLNDMFYDGNCFQKECPKGVFVGGLKQFSDQHPEILGKYYGKVANVEEGITAFNTMFVQDGFIVYVPQNTVVEKPIQLINILKSDMDNYMVNRRILIIAEENAQVKILTCDHTNDTKHFLITQVTEIFADKNAIIDFYELEENSDDVCRLAATYVRQGEASNVLINNMTINCGTTRNNYYVNLEGQHTETYVCGMAIADRKQYVDNFVFMDHKMPSCHSTQLFKYVLQDSAKGAFCGRIVVEQDAQKTIAYQSNNNLCVSSDARMYSKPQLEIYADDVKCSHGLTTGELDEEALFYLRSRGIPEQQAKLLLMQAFTADVLNHIRINTLKERLTDLVEKRLKGETARCGNCALYITN